MASRFGECPICCEEYQYLEDIEFYPCNAPCKFQCCRLCLHRMETCPFCKQAFEETNFRRVKNPFNYLTYNQKRDAQVVNKCGVIIMCSLPRQELEKFGQIKVYQRTSGKKPLTFVVYMSESAAQDCIQSINNVTFQGQIIRCQYLISHFCQSFLNHRKCADENCQNVHNSEIDLQYFQGGDLTPLPPKVHRLVAEGIVSYNQIQKQVDGFQFMAELAGALDELIAE